jgi:Right handed beta helix region
MTDIRRIALRAGAFIVAPLAGLALLPAAAGAAASTTYYVSPTGNDSAAGTSSTTSWRTLDRVNAQVLRPGQAVLLQGGAKFTGTLRFVPGDGGDANSPVWVGSYGTGGRATIAPANDSAVVVYDTAGVAITDLTLLGSAGTKKVSGINAWNDLPGDQKLSGLQISRVEVSGFLAGIAVGGGNGASGFKNVLISDSTTHDNVEAGLTSYGPAFDATNPKYAHEQVTVRNVHAYRNRGDITNVTTNTGNGIVLGSVKNALIESSQANDNGDLCYAPEGPVGIWTYDSDSVTIQKSVSHHNRTGGKADGDGFDLDQNVSNSVLQNNLAFANDGAGILVYTGKDNGAHKNNVIRYNVNVGNGVRLGWLGDITVWGPLTGVTVEHNTVIARSVNGQKPPALRLQTGISGVTVRQNILVSDNAGNAVQAEGLANGAVTLNDNNYYVAGRSWAVGWNSATYTSLSAWRTATGQESRYSAATGSTVNPLLTNLKVVLTADSTDRRPVDVTGLTGVQLSTSSPLRGMLPGVAAFTSTAGSTVSDVFGKSFDPSTATALGAHQP